MDWRPMSLPQNIWIKKTHSLICCLQIFSFNILLSSISWSFSRFSLLLSWTRWSLWWSNWSLSWRSWSFSRSNRSFSHFSWPFSWFSWSFSQINWSFSLFSWSFCRFSWSFCRFSCFFSRTRWSLWWRNRSLFQISWFLASFSWSLSRSSWSLSKIRLLMSLSDILVILLVELWSELLEHSTAGKENRWEDSGYRIRNTLVIPDGGNWITLQLLHSETEISGIEKL